MVRGAMEATRLMIIGFFLLIAFVTYVFFSQVKKRYILPLVFGCIASPLFSAAAAFGVLSWLNYDMYTIMCVAPFLILGIGVDDCFILSNSFVNSTHIKDMRKRVTFVLISVGPSITITTLTNIFAFAIGVFTPARQMSMLCCCTSIAILIDFILTFTLFLPCLILIGKQKGEKKSDFNELKKRKKEIWAKNYVTFICSKKGKVVAVFLVAILYIFSSYGLANMKATFEPSKAFPSDSPLSNSMEEIRKVFNEHFPVNIYIQNPPDLANKEDYKQFYELISDIEKMPEAYDRKKSLLILDKYEEFDRKTHALFSSIGFSTGNYSPSFDNMPFYLDNIFATERIKYNKETKKLDKLAITFLAHNMSEWSLRAAFLEKTRKIVEKYPQFEAFIFDADSSVLDMILNVRTDMMGSIAVTIACMAVICFFFIPDYLGLFIIITTIFSICYNLVGFLALFGGADLDPVTMVDVLIATGFSVDYTAHIAAHFYASTENRHKRIASSLIEMSEPMLNAGISTVLCMLPIIFIKTYAIVAFAKTIFAVVFLGLFHGLFILPCLLSLVKITDKMIPNIDEILDRDCDKKPSLEPFLQED
uniref:SSD domain-containing protein n=1 Tax=Rhabditophanes sp. KR3021 TaxID=114890 RepID=A0AC35U0P5_9BILA